MKKNFLAVLAILILVFAAPAFAVNLPSFANRAGTIAANNVGSLTAAADVAVDWSAANAYKLTPGEDETLTSSNGVPGERYTLIVTTSGTTSRTLTFGTGFKTTGTLATGTTSAKVFTVSFVFDGVTMIEVSRTTAM